jgi:hypothetical protein
MKKVTLLCGLLLAVSASIASAAGVGLRWSSCLSDGGTANRAFACTSNTGSNILVGTFELGADLPSTSGEEIIVDLASASSPLPAWWQFKNVGTCRTGSLAIGAAPPGSAINCSDWGGGLAGAGLGAYNIGGAAGANTARIIAASAVPPSGLQDLTAGSEYFAFTLTINNLKSTGLGSCAGCSDAVCIVFNSLNMTTPVLANNVFLSGPSNGSDANFVTWQGGAGITSGRGIGCPAATPTKSKTWSQVKSMYR